MKAAKGASNTTQKGNGASESTALAPVRSGFLRWPPPPAIQGGARNPAYAPAPITWVEPADENGQRRPFFAL
jgi:hypothetical protein